MTAPTAIMLHHLHEPNATYPPSSGSLGPRQFTELLEAYPDHTLVFDDGLKCQLDIAVPILEALGRKAIFCVTTGHFEGRAATIEPHRDFRERVGLANFYARFANITRGVQVPEGSPDDFPDFYSAADIKFQRTRDAMPPAAYDSIMEGMGLDVQKEAERLYLSQGDLLELTRRGFYVGLHSHTHPLKLSEMTASEQRDEWQSNKDWVESSAQQVVAHASYPSDQYSALSEQILTTLGVFAAYRAGEDVRYTDTPMEITRIDHHQACIDAGIKL